MSQTETLVDKVLALIILTMLIALVSVVFVEAVDKEQQSRELAPADRAAVVATWEK